MRRVTSLTNLIAVGVGDDWPVLEGLKLARRDPSRARRSSFRVERKTARVLVGAPAL